MQRRADADEIAKRYGLGIDRAGIVGIEPDALGITPWARVL